MQISEFNGLSGADADALLRPCLDVDRWVRGVADGRPYEDAEDCLRAAREAADPLTAEEVESALAAHPRIGERPAGDSAEAAHSRREQSGLGALEESVEARLAAGNAEYERVFGRVFLIRAAGRSAEEILAQLELRLTNPPDAELLVTGEQLHEIAVLRLREILR